MPPKLRWKLVLINPYIDPIKKQKISDKFVLRERERKVHNNNKISRKMASKALLR